MNAKLAEFELRLDDGEPADIQAEPEDHLAKFIEQAKLAGEVGWHHAARFEEETSHINTHADAALRKQNTETSDFEETLILNSQTLAKLETSSDRKKQNCRAWLREQVALGKTSRELISYAQKHDLAVANMLREIAAELGV